MRRRSREAVLQHLYRQEYIPAPSDVPDQDLETEDAAFAQTLLTGVQKHRAEIDPIIDRRALGWGLDRLPLVDRNLLRLSLFELLYTDTPPEVVISEAVELAKTYGTEHAPAVVNGILDRVWKERDGAGALG